MKNLNKYNNLIRLIIGILFIYIFGSKETFFILLIYLLVFLMMVIRTLMVPSKKRVKTYLIVLYSFILSIQIIFISVITIKDNQHMFQIVLGRVLSCVATFLPFIIERFVTINKYASFYLPSANELTSIGFSEIKDNTEKIIKEIKNIEKAGKAFSAENLNDILNDLPRHNSFEYINKEMLTDDYFSEADLSLTDPNIYIVISNTGSAASEIISTFTQKQYNHASISFDYDLKTIISYNGGERIYPPGLNHEIIEYFNKKCDASIIVYKLSCTLEQKKIILEKVKEINNEGSAYNMMGLLLKYSHKPNIMFCSQFVYKMLSYAGIEYFHKKDGEVKPTDLVELDYYRKLEFAYEIKLNETNETFSNMDL